MLCHGMTFHRGFAKVLSPTIFEIYFPFHKDIWIDVTDYYIYFYLTELFLLVAKL